MNDYTFITTPYNVDRKLYKYFSNVAYAVDSIQKGHIHLDDPSAFNDPFDAAFCLQRYSILTSFDSIDTIISNIIRYIINSNLLDHKSEALRRLVALHETSSSLLSNGRTKQVRAAIKSIYTALGSVPFSFEEFCDLIDDGYANGEGFKKLDCRISCFSEIRDSILMWSYYANSHKGVCVEYDISKLDLNVDLNRKIKRSMTKVHYSPIRADNLHINDTDDLMNFVVSKSDVWAHEHEWRIVCETSEEFLPFDCVTGIYLGVSFDRTAPKYQEILRAARNRHVDIHQCKLNTDKYEIDTEKVYDASYMSTADQVINESSNSIA